MPPHAPVTAAEPVVWYANSPCSSSPSAASDCTTQQAACSPPQVTATVSTTVVDNNDDCKPAAQQPQRVSRRRRRKRAVRFQDDVSIREIPALEDISEEEVSAVWYNESDYDAIKDETQKTLERLTNDEPITEELGYCIRGLEGKTEFGARRRKSNKAAALNTVWDTQVALWDQKQDPAAGIAQAYRRHSLQSKFPAIEAAMNDQKYVNDYVR